MKIKSHDENGWIANLQIPAVFVALGEGEDWEAHGGQAEVQREQDAHPLATHF